MSNQAMNLAFGDFIIIELALTSYLKDFDLSMQAGQYVSEILGKIEYELARLREAASTQLAPGLTPQGSQ